MRGGQREGRLRVVELAVQTAGAGGGVSVGRGVGGHRRRLALDCPSMPARSRTRKRGLWRRAARLFGSIVCNGTCRSATLLYILSATTMSSAPLSPPVQLLALGTVPFHRPGHRLQPYARQVELETTPT